MSITSRFASQFDHERCIAVKQPAGAARMPFKTLVRQEKLRLRFVYLESNIQHAATYNPSPRASPRSYHCDRSEVHSMAEPEMKRQNNPVLKRDDKGPGVMEAQ
jgi:hypothetical protein